MQHNWSGLIVLAGLLAGSPVVIALEVEPGVGVGLLYTDNAKLSDDNEEDDLVVVTYAGVRVNENSGSFRLNAEAEWIHLNYTKNTYSDQNYPALRLTGEWEQIRDRLDWRVHNYYTQTLANSLDGATPDNTRDTNVFTFGPTIRFPISGRQTVTVNPEYRNFYYEDSDNNDQYDDVDEDNQQFALSANWFYSLYPTMGLSLDGGVTQVDYNDGRATDYTRSTAHAGLSGTRARSSYSLNLGGTKINRDNSGGESGFSGNLSWSRNLTGHSSARVYMSTDLTSTDNLLLDSQTNPDDGDFSNVQSSDDVVRNNIVRLTYRREDSTLNSAVWGEFRKLDYEGDQDNQSDRDVREIGAELDYSVTASLSSGLFGRYRWTDETDTDRTTDRYSITGRVTYQLTRKLRATIDVRYQNQDSDGGSGNEYSAFSTFVRLVYGFARVRRPNGG